jgi:hypothetical protein
MTSKQKALLQTFKRNKTDPVFIILSVNFIIPSVISRLMVIPNFFCLLVTHASLLFSSK